MKTLEQALQVYADLAKDFMPCGTMAQAVVILGAAYLAEKERADEAERKFYETACIRCGTMP